MLREHATQDRRRRDRLRRDGRGAGCPAPAWLPARSVDVGRAGRGPEGALPSGALRRPGLRRLTPRGRAAHHGEDRRRRGGPARPPGHRARLRGGLLHGRLCRVRHGAAPSGSAPRPGAAGHPRRGRWRGGAEESGDPGREDAARGLERRPRRVPAEASGRHHEDPAAGRGSEPTRARSSPRLPVASRTRCTAWARAPIPPPLCARSASPLSWCAGPKTPSLRSPNRKQCTGPLRAAAWK